MQVTTVPDAEAVAARAADEVAVLLSAAIVARGVAHIALAGGSSPKRCHELLAERGGIDWPSVHVWVSDERCVPLDHEDANWRMVEESLLSKVDAVAHPPPAPLGPDEGAARYEESVRADVPEGVFDVVMCGMGPDGHTLSLFPGHPEVQERSRLVAGVRDSPKPPPERITDTLPLCWAARRTILLAAGAEKADALGRVLAGEDPMTPASLLRGGRLLVLADDAASG